MKTVKKPSIRAQLITRRTYNRPLDEEGNKFESWEQTIERVISHQRWLWETQLGKKLNKTQEAELSAFSELMLERKALLSGRTLWLGGTEVSRERQSSMFNCSHARVETVYDVVDCLWLLLQGCGVGFTPVRGTLNGFFKPIKAIEVIRSTRTEKGGDEHNKETWEPISKVWTLSIGDSAESWAKSIGKMLAGKYPADKLILDFSGIRPAGQRLKGYGWISSGDEAISKAYVAIANLMNRRAGSLLSVIDILDILNHLGTILSSRRSAEIALLDAEDPEWRDFASAKKEFWLGNNHRCQSNNSLVFYSKPTRARLIEIFSLMIASGGSEPGFINGASALKRAPWFAGVNPCLTGNTLVVVPERGLVRIKELSGKSHLVIDQNGDKIESAFEMTSSNANIFELELSNGAIIEATEYHNFVLLNGDKCQLKDLKQGDELMVADVSDQFGDIHEPQKAYIDAWMIADGTWYNNKDSSKLYIYPPKEDHIPTLEAAGLSFRKDGETRYTAQCAGRPMPSKNKVPDYVLSGDKETILAFIQGSIESDGTICEGDKGWMIQFWSCERGFLQDLQALLRLIGARAHISMGTKEGMRLLPDGNGGYKDYQCRDCWRLTVSNPLSIIRHLYPALVKRGPYAITEKITVAEVRSTNRFESVYCAGVPTTNSFALPWIMSGNCGEILLGNKSFCNLSEIDIAKFSNDPSGLREAVRLTARANYRQTCVDLRDGVLQEAWHLNNEFLRLCGVGLTGIARRPDMTPYDYQEIQRIATGAAYGMAEELGTASPKNVTTVKPSGSMSKIMDTTEGVHKPLGKYIFNNVNFGLHDPIVEKARQAGYKVFNNPTDPEAVLVTFPVIWEGVEFANIDGFEVNLDTAVAQLEAYKRMQDHWTQQNTSVTISYDPSEVDSIIDWLMLNWDSYVGVSFIYRADPTRTAADLGYLYLPQEVVTKQVYDDYVLQLKEIDIDGSNSFLEIKDEECATGACPIK